MNDAEDRLINAGYHQVMFMAWLGMISADVYCIDELIKETPNPPLRVHIPFSPFDWPGLPLSASFFLRFGSIPPTFILAMISWRK
jgi:hypothetical protein